MRPVTENVPSGTPFIVSSSREKCFVSLLFFLQFLYVSSSEAFYFFNFCSLHCVIFLLHLAMSSSATWILSPTIFFVSDLNSSHTGWKRERERMTEREYVWMWENRRDREKNTRKTNFQTCYEGVRSRIQKFKFSRILVEETVFRNPLWYVYTC